MLNSERDEMKKIEMLLEKYIELKVIAKTEWGRTIFHRACIFNQPWIASILIKNYAKIALDIQDKLGLTALHYACNNSESTELVEMMIENAELSKLDFRVKISGRGATPFQLAESNRNHKIVDLIKKKLPAGKF